MSHKDIPFVFFGTGPLAESVLAALVRNGYMPSLVVTKPDSLQGRHMLMVSPHIKTWAEMKGIPVLQPIKLDSEFHQQLVNSNHELFVVASYGKIIPDDILAIPKHGILNVHPSLLPLYRGPSPIESALLDGLSTTGVSIIKLDSGMDSGPILVQNAFEIPKEVTAGMLEVLCGQIGGDLLVQVLPQYVDGVLIPKEQEHARATICKKITKELGEITLDTAGEEVIRKYRAFTPWPSLYFFHEHEGKTIRVKVTNVDVLMSLSNETKARDVILSVIPEGKKEIPWEDFVRGYMSS